MKVNIRIRGGVDLLATPRTAGDVCQPGHAAAAATGQARRPRAGELRRRLTCYMVSPALITSSPGTPLKLRTAAHCNSAPLTLPQVWQRVAEGGPLTEKCNAPFRLRMLAQREGKPLGAGSAAAAAAAARPPCVADNTNTCAFHLQLQLKDQSIKSCHRQAACRTRCALAH